MQTTAKPKGLTRIRREIGKPLRKIGRFFCRLKYMCKRRDKIELYYFSARPNFGDSLNTDIFYRMFGIDVVESNKKHCDVVAIGSLLEAFVSDIKNLSRTFDKYLCSRLFVWGTGFIESPKYENEQLLRRMNICAVRGYLTLERLKKITGEPLEKVAVADPGLLVSRLFDTSKIKKKYTLGIIPHYVDEGNPLLNKIRVENTVVLDIKQPPDIFTDRLAECENVMSSAMHGLIAADSLGIPNIRMILSDKVIGGDYKFNDYYSAFGIENHSRINLNQREFSDNDLPGIKENYRTCQKKVVELQDALIASFPYKKVKK